MRRSSPPPHSGHSVLKQSPAPSISCLHLLWALLVKGEDFLAMTAWSPIPAWGPPHSGSPLHHTLPSRGPGLWGQGSVGRSVDTGQGCTLGWGSHLRAAVCLEPHLKAHPPTPSSTSDALGSAPALPGPPAPPETTAEGRGRCLPPPLTRRRLSSGR